MATNDNLATKDDIKQLEQRLEKKLDATFTQLVGIINNFAKHVDHRFDLVESRLDTVAIDISKIKAQQDVMQQEYDRLVEAAGF